MGDEPVVLTTGTTNVTWWVKTPCENRMIEDRDDEPCDIEEWIRTDGLSTGFLTCERHLGTAGYITWPPVVDMA